MTNPSPTPRQIVINQIKVLLANNLIDVQLEIDDYNTAVDLAIEQYRQRSSNSMKEVGFFLMLDIDKSTYTLPQDVVEVSAILRRGMGGGETIANSQQYDPFVLAYTNLYLLQPTGQGNLLTYELYYEWMETAGRLFGATYDFLWDRPSRQLTILRHQLVKEEILLKSFILRPENELLTDAGSLPWIRKYALAQSKFILGQAYEKFASLPGPNGGVTLNGSSLKSEAQAEMLECEEIIKNYADHATPLGFLIG